MPMQCPRSWRHAHPARWPLYMRTAHSISHATHTAVTSDGQFVWRSSHGFRQSTAWLSTAAPPAPLITAAVHWCLWDWRHHHLRNVDDGVAQAVGAVECVYVGMAGLPRYSWKLAAVWAGLIARFGLAV